MPLESKKPADTPSECLEELKLLVLAIQHNPFARGLWVKFNRLRAEKGKLLPQHLDWARDRLILARIVSDHKFGPNLVASLTCMNTDNPWLSPMLRFIDFGDSKDQTWQLVPFLRSHQNRTPFSKDQPHGVERTLRESFLACMAVFEAMRPGAMGNYTAAHSISAFARRLLFDLQHGYKYKSLHVRANAR